ncbi:S26 family signal peptidase [Micromonospora sp. NPDC047557]|uniref:S26 family signal peptidase n=1 Tax=Micromonospora sp. NPDC047557 TaxID=3364250 RepID=UPI00371D7ED0
MTTTVTALDTSTARRALPRRPLAVLGALALLALALQAPVLALLCAAAATVAAVRSAVAALLGRRLVAVTVRGHSMWPSYRDGDLVLVRRTSSPTVGQVVVVRRWIPAATGQADDVLDGGEWLIKRVAAVAGDPVPRDQCPVLRGVPEQAVPRGRLVLLGDNREVSVDSRTVGYFSAEQVLGVALNRGTGPRPGRGPTSAAWTTPTDRHPTRS